MNHMKQTILWKRNIIKRFISLILAICLCSSMLILSSGTTNENANKNLGIISAISSENTQGTVHNRKDESDKKDYIICTKTSSGAEQLLAKNAGNFKMLGQTKKLISAQLLDEDVALIASDPNVKYIEEDFVVTANNDAETPEYIDFSPWNLEAIGANSAQDANPTGNGVKIAVLDSGVDIYSEVWPAGGIDLVDPEFTCGDDMTGHGTGVVGIIASPINDSGLVGVAPDAEIYNVRVLDDSNMSNISRIVEGLDWCIENDIDIINMSFGTNNYSRVLDEKITEVAQTGTIMVSSAGNDNNIQYPAKFDDVIAVGSINSSMEKSLSSATGQELEFVAPGENVLSASLIGGFCAQSGTSIAAPHITGAIAILLEKDPNSSSEFIRALLAASANDLGDSMLYGNGLIDIDYALEIYDDFKASYSNGSYIPPTNTGNVETYEEDDVFVEGTWSAAGHDGTIDYSYNQRPSYDLRFPYYVKAVSKSMDTRDYLKNHPDNIGITNPNDYRYKGSLAAHGNGNYIVAAKMLYEIAVTCKIGEGLNYTNYRPDFAAGNLLGTDYENIKTDIRYALLYYNSDNVALDYSLIPGLNGSGATSFVSITQKRATIIFGMLFHYIGDIYAHRSIVPSSSTSVTNSTQHNSPNSSGHNQGLYFVSSDFNDRNDCGNHSYSQAANRILLNYAYNLPSNRGNICSLDGTHTSLCYCALNRLAGLGVLQFKDIKYFLNGYDTTQEYKENQRYYEDRANQGGNEFYSRRYLAAKGVTNKIFNDFYNSVAGSGAEPFYPYNLLPLYTVDGVNLHNLHLKIDQYYNYLYNFHSSSAVLKQSTWGTNDSLFYYTTIVHNGNKYHISSAAYPTDAPTYTATPCCSMSLNDFYID